MKPDNVYKRALNATLELVKGGEFALGLPSENQLRARIGVSRTTVRKVIRELANRGIVVEQDGNKVPGRPVSKHDLFSGLETTSRLEHVERQFMEWMLRGGAAPGTLINELELARQFHVATNGIREFLIRFSRFGLVEKKSNSGWLFKGFTEDFALELFEVRVMFELRSARHFAELPEGSSLWGRLETIRRQHVDLLDSVEARFHDFSDLDNRFHRLINESGPNRFIDGFSDIITLIFHYHYQWNKADEKERNKAAILEHLTCIDALQSRNRRRIETAWRAHLRSARDTLVRSLAR
ncbi:DNA-binding transcriptional regulator, GntR family [Mesorhizobium albiziae]|uniref:DNA-binding transcriptional regulator, GntR family n=1 Tax=Neomesorhizobium albiziae TaxID=335020 RepID=A0A1I4CQC3_9HYPH|nr:GntR family transcriptional regulator [Mesorhizobium albiziae]GLS30938.1 GntR family transcriptional regulator [Mesorhizobium albiziae]SFK82963.1 DNA-binding transcriptional regulator, GntR family [Mesorhizobium albiziae]